MKLCSLKLQKLCWLIVSIIILVIGIVLLFLFGDETLTSTHTTISNGVTTVTYGDEYPGWVLGIAVITFGILYLFVACVFIPLVGRLIKKGEIDYPVSDAKTSKEILLLEACNINDDPFSNILVEVYGDWIDVTYNWKNCLSLDNGIVKNQSIYKKMILIKDNYTYQELDFEGVGDIDLSLNRLSVHKQMRIGRMNHRVIEYSFGKDLNTDHVGINRYELNTMNITNEIHKWLASHGYKLDE